MTPEVLAQIKGHAALQFTAAEVEVMLGLEPGSIAADPDAERTYMAGNLLAQAVARKRLYDLVQEGDRSAAVAFIRLAERNGLELVVEE